MIPLQSVLYRHCTEITSGWHMVHICLGIADPVHLVPFDRDHTRISDPTFPKRQYAVFLTGTKFDSENAKFSDWEQSRISHFDRDY